MPLRLAGYAPVLHVAPGQTVPVHVSTPLPQYWARLLRMNGAIGAEMSDWVRQSTPVATSTEGPWPGADVPIVRGSHATVSGVNWDGPATLSVKFWQRQPAVAESTLLHLEFESGILDLCVEPDDTLLLRIVDPRGRTFRRGIPLTVRPKQWHDVALAYDGPTGRVAIGTRGHGDNLVGRFTVAEGPAVVGALVLISLGGVRAIEEGAPNRFRGDLDGKVERLCLWGADATELDAIVGTATDGPWARWEFPPTPDTGEVVDAGGRFPPVVLGNAPTRAVTSSDWHGQQTDFARAPDLYAAIYLHRDDLADAEWPVAFDLTIPAESPSGVYCLVLSATPEPELDDLESFFPVPLFVTGQPDTVAEIALVLPTFSYRAYANNTLYADADPAIYERRGPTRSAIVYEYCLHQQLRSLYCAHPDNSGVHIASLLRPQASVRPDLISQLHGFPHQLSADLEIVQWLESLGIPYDVLTDEQLHEQGGQVLAPYRVVLTGSHPEYSTDNLLDAYTAHLDAGGSLMYLGANGFFLRVAIDTDRPWLQELRRGDAGIIWDDAPGESHHQIDGQRGGLWRRIGRPPNLLTGLGFSAIGFSGEGTFSVPSGFDVDVLPPRLRAEILRVGSARFGVAGLELDCHDPLLGSDPDAAVFGELAELPPHYVPTGEYLGFPMPDAEAAVTSALRANLIFQRNAGGGHTASFGSIRWTSALNTPDDPAAVRSITTAALNDLLGSSPASDRPSGVGQHP